MFDIVKGSKEKVELKIHNDFKKIMKEDERVSTLPGYSVEQLLDVVLMYDKAD